MTEKFAVDDQIKQLCAEVYRLRNRQCRTCQSWQPRPAGRIGRCDAASLDRDGGHFWAYDSEEWEEGVLLTTPNFGCNEWCEKESDVTEGAKEVATTAAAR